MITKLDKVVARYLFVLDEPRPSPTDDAAIYSFLERADQARFDVLDMLIRKPRYRSLHCRCAWKRKDNPHRPVTV